MVSFSKLLQHLQFHTLLYMLDPMDAAASGGPGRESYEAVCDLQTRQQLSS